MCLWSTIFMYCTAILFERIFIPICFCGVCAPLEYKHSCTIIVTWVKGRRQCLFSYLSLSLRGVNLIYIIGDWPFTFYLFYALFMLKFCCSFWCWGLYAKLNNFLLSFTEYVMLIFLCYGETCMTLLIIEFYFKLFY